MSQFDHSKGVPPDIIGVVIQIDDSGFVIDTKVGKIKGKLARNQLECVSHSGLRAEELPLK